MLAPAYRVSRHSVAWGCHLTLRLQSQSPSSEYRGWGKAGASLLILTRVTLRALGWDVNSGSATGLVGTGCAGSLNSGSVWKLQ